MRGLGDWQKHVAQGDRLNFARVAAPLGVCLAVRDAAPRCAQAWHVDCFVRPRVWRLGFRPRYDGAAGPRAAARDKPRVHGGTKARETSAAGIGRSRRCSACFNACRGIAAHETPHRQPVRRRRIACDRHLRRRSRGQEGVQCRLVDLCRLDAVALCRRCRHRQEVGRQIRHHHQRHPDQRLRRIDQPVHGRQVRRGDRHQHGRAHHPRRRRRRFQRHHHGRLLQRQ